jgi:PHD/YefM family antitoxin component YafN of YafNO toxin-antitoxin module
MNISTAREKLPDAVELAHTEAVFLERYGRRAAVLLSPERYEAYRIELRPAAACALRKLDPPVARSLQGAISLLAQDPRPPAARPLKGAPRSAFASATTASSPQSRTTSC